MLKNNSQPNWQYLTRETGLILLWAYVILVAGTVTGLINFRIHVFSTILGVAVFGLWMVRCLSQRRRILLSGVEWGVLGFMSAQFLALLFSQDVRRSLSPFMLYGVYILVFYFVSDLIRRAWPIELFEKTLLIVGGIVAGLALFQLAGAYFSWKSMAASLTYAPSFNYRLYAIFGDANLLAAFVNILIPISIGRIFSSRRLFTSILLGGLLIGIFMIVYFSSSRGGILGDLAAIFVMVVGWIALVSDRARAEVEKLWNYLRARPLMLSVIALALAAPVVLILLRTLQFQGDATHGPILSSRVTFWGAAWDAFRSSPWMGIGPGTYPSAYVQYNAVPPDRPYLHAHSVPFTLAAESGVVGLIGLGIFLFFIARRVWAARQALTLEARVRWMTIVASLTGFCIHSLVDNFLPYVSVGIVVTVLFALLLAQNRTDTNRPEASRHNTFSVLWLLLPALIIAGFGFYSLRAYWDNEAAIDAASAGDWERAASAFEQALEHDPWLAHYPLQGGYTYGVIAADGDEAALQSAINLTERGIALEPGYALHYANLGALYRQAGNYPEALANMTRAVELEPQVPIFWLNVGIYAESMSLQDEARRAYAQLLELQPELAETDFWTQSTLRSEVLTSWNASRPRTDLPQSLITRGRLATENGDFSTAEEFLVEAWQQNDQNVKLYLAFAELALARGQLDEAENYLHAALWIQDIWSNAEKVMPLLNLAEISLMQGDSETALIQYRQVYEAVTDYTIYGWGTRGWNPYAWFVFQRRSLPVDILPQFVRPPLQSDLIERLLPLVDLYRDRGEIEAANEVYHQLTGDAY